MPSLADASSLMTLFGDPTRVRLLALLARHELTVAELTAHHRGWRSRASRPTSAGCRRRGCSATGATAPPPSTAASDAMPAAARALDAVLAAQLDDAALEADRGAAARRSRARGRARGPTRSRGRWSGTTRRAAPGRRRRAGFSAWSRLGRRARRGSRRRRDRALLAPRARSITCLDRSQTVLAAARPASAHRKNVRFALGDMHELAVRRRSLRSRAALQRADLRARSGRAIAEAARVLRPGGALALVTLGEHQHIRSHRRLRPRASRASSRRR